MKLIIEIEDDDEINAVLDAIKNIKSDKPIKAKNALHTKKHKVSKKKLVFEALDKNNGLKAAELSDMIKGLSKANASTYLSLYRKNKKIAANN
jgi:hypothetical protein